MSDRGVESRVSAERIEAPSVFGRERAMIDALAELLNKSIRTVHPYSAVRESRRGSWFEVQLADGRVAKVTVELDRVEP